MSLDDIMRQQERETATEKVQINKQQKNVKKQQEGGLNFDYIKQNEADIFKNLPKQNKKKAPMVAPT